MNDIELVISEVLDHYPVKRAGLFGSAAKNELKDESDIDILVEFFPVPIGLLFFGLIEDLQEALNRQVDIVDSRFLTRSKRHRFCEAIMQEVRYFYEREVI